MTTNFDDAIRTMRDLALRDSRDDLHLLCQIALGLYQPEPHSHDEAVDPPIGRSAAEESAPITDDRRLAHGLPTNSVRFRR